MWVVDKPHLGCVLTSKQLHPGYVEVAKKILLGCVWVANQKRSPNANTVRVRGNNSQVGSFLGQARKHVRKAGSPKKYRCDGFH